jgi:hypothetical protein
MPDISDIESDNLDQNINHTNCFELLKYAPTDIHKKEIIEHFKNVLNIYEFNKNDVDQATDNIIKKINKFVFIDNLNLDILEPYKNQSFELGSDYISYESDNFYAYVYNNPTEYVKKIIDNYHSHMQRELDILPDIYLLCGFINHPTDNLYQENLFDCKYDKNPSKIGICINNILVSLNKFFVYHNIWKIFYTIVCIFAQIIAPIYYILIMFNKYIYSCQNTSEIIGKLFSIVFFFV